MCYNKTMDKDLEQIISQVCGCNFPRNIVAVCEKMGIIVQETGRFSDDISGMIFKENDKYYILVNKYHSIGRKSFTIAHELGHYILHRQLLEEESQLVSYIKSNDKTLPALARGLDYNSIEKEANNFAADILMPENEFKLKCECANSIEEVANYFGVSVQAATIRANNLGGWFFL